MKKIKFILGCMANRIKNKIFKSQKTDISQECEKVLELGEKVLGLDEEITSIEELKLTEEYAIKYNTTTRWQTL